MPSDELGGSPLTEAKLRKALFELAEDVSDPDEHPFGLDTEPVSSLYESIGEYRKGGHHPIDIGDILNDRYQVFNKLGDGGYGIVWLCFDQKTDLWRAVKILRADQSNPESQELKFWNEFAAEDQPAFAPPIEYFWVDGPNGRHLCFVFVLSGPHLQQVQGTADLESMKKAFRRATEALSYLHNKGFCHSDFTISNILHKIHGLDTMSKGDMMETIGPPKRDAFEVVSGCKPTRRQPKHLIWRLDCRAFRPFIVPGEVVVVDFGGAFRVSDPPETFIGIPINNMAPELFFGMAPSPASDMWALACNIMALYGAPYFGKEENDVLDQNFRCNTSGSVLDDMERCLGALPSKFRDAYDESHQGFQPAARDPGGRLMWCLGNRDPKALRRWRRAEARRTGCDDPFEGRLLESLGRFNISGSEFHNLLDLLRNMLKMDPDDSGFKCILERDIVIPSVGCISQVNN
ncbi:hypothetical protein JX266_011193 [Neoarthrinium moseri]|uniref:uncharacterized protein n=1 Tax=Neoarthrinium moseri TaxID=1658444 RepID=UPI001FDD18A0|nr:uncharacterized protein JN550_013058 [Neoarthrinium moseri]KAI1842580.1 hypothetical protein JX266_011193 [Neoarthrinium moseri]KAI1857795.1 hypothetical protein JN550_013058 [Neoarthrinium moseri]